MDQDFIVPGALGTKNKKRMLTSSNHALLKYRLEIDFKTKKT